MSNGKKLCFVIMPFSETSKKHTEEYWTAHFQNFLKPLIEENNRLEARRSKPLRGDILRQIITNLVSSPIVVADLTDFNPNVFWELGVRQSFKHGTITIAEAGTSLPFDVFAKSTLFYHDNHIGNKQFYSDFKKALAHCLANPNSPDSSVLETLSGRGSLYEIIHRAETLRRLDALLEECTWNQEVIAMIADGVKENKKHPEKRQIVTARFLSAAMELLIVNRYLDEEKPFYSSIEICLGGTKTLNDQLMCWDQNAELTEKWFEENLDAYKGRFGDYKKALTNARKKISEKVSEVIF